MVMQMITEGTVHPLRPATSQIAIEFPEGCPSQRAATAAFQLAGGTVEKRWLTTAFERPLRTLEIPLCRRKLQFSNRRFRARSGHWWTTGIEKRISIAVQSDLQTSAVR